MSSIEKSSVKMACIATVGYLFKYGSLIYLAQLLTASDYGDFAVAMSLAILLSSIVDLGSSKIILHYLVVYSNSGDYSRISGLLRGATTLSLWISLLIAVGIISLVVIDDVMHLSNADYLRPDWLSIVRKSSGEELHPLILVLWFVPFITLSNIFAALLKSRNLRFIFDLPRVFAFGLMLLLIMLFASFGLLHNEWVAVALYGAMNVVVFVIYVVMVVRYMPPKYITTKPTYEWRKWLAMSISLMASQVFFLLLRQVNLYMVEIIDHDQARVGFFAAADELAQSILLLYINLNLFYVPLIIKAIHDGREFVKKTLLKMSLILSIFCLIFLVGLFFFGKFILGLFGPDYVQAYVTMLILASGLCVNVIVGGYITYLQYATRNNFVLIVQVLTLGIAVLLNLFLIPQFGIIGAGITSAVCFVTMSLILAFYALRLLYKS